MHPAHIRTTRLDLLATVTGSEAEIAWVVGAPWQGRGLTPTDQWQGGEIRWRRATRP